MAATVAGCAHQPATQNADASAVVADATTITVTDGAAGTDPCAVPVGLPETSAPSLRAFIEALPHGPDFDSLDPAQLQAVADAAQALWRGDFPVAGTRAGGAGFEVARLRTGAECLFLLRPTASAPRGQATLVVRSPGGTRDLLVEAPHVPYDGHTDSEAAILFDAARLRGLLVAGAARCASTAPSGCHANTQCSTGFSVESDPAHSTHTAFHAVHLGLATGTGTTAALQLHTNLEPTINGDAMVSTGARGAFTAGSHGERFYQALVLAAAPTGDIRTCNDPAHPADASAYCGVTSTQALASNGATDPCNGLIATTTTDRFVHLEQSTARLKDVDTWSAIVATAVRAAY